MSEQQNDRTITAIQKMISQMQHLVDHPRMQQRNWVALGREWLPVLHHAIEDLSRPNAPGTTNTGTAMPEDSKSSILIKVNASHPETYIRFYLQEVKSVVVYRGGEPGYAYVRGAHSSVELNDGRKYLTTPDEAQRVVDALRE